MGSSKKGHSRVGGRGGETTRTTDGSMVRKSFWFPVRLNEALRTRAFEEHRTEASIVREVVGKYLDS